MKSLRELSREEQHEAAFNELERELSRLEVHELKWRVECERRNQREYERSLRFAVWLAVAVFLGAIILVSATVKYGYMDRIRFACSRI